jgi:histidinol dehydrogenase
VTTRARVGETGFWAALAEFCREAAAPPSIGQAVAAILADVRARGDRAVAAYAAKFDGARFGPADFRVPAADVRAAMRKLPARERAALVSAHRSIRDFNARGLPKGWLARNRHGGRVGEKFDPIRRVGLYIPGGEVPLVSTVLMTATLARIAGCPEIAAFTPAKGAGEIAPGILAALAVAGVTEVYRIGGVQAIAAMAYGTQSIPAVDKIFGPGNAYVCEAKRQVFGVVGVDSLPGPSEVMVVADATAEAAYAAADLLAQAEHGSGREKIFLVTLDGRKRSVADTILAEAARQVKISGRSAKIVRVLDEGFFVAEADSPDEAAAVANYVAPEHLQLMVGRASARRLTRAITTAGAIFIGNESPTVLGDFAAGPSHVLPTARAARFSSGLRTADFLRRTSLVEYGPRSLRAAAPTLAAFAAMERLDAHGRSAALRLE